MEVNRLLTTVNRNERESREIKYIVVHYVGALGGAEANCRYYANNYVGGSAHYFIDHDGSVWQSVEEKDIAWHCGAASYRHAECRNSNSIGIELCVRKADAGHFGADDTDWYFTPETVAGAVLLVRELMERYSIPAENVLRHYDVTGKCCPNPWVMEPSFWEAFKEALQAGDAMLTPIEGKAQASQEQMAAYMVRKNPGAASYAAEHARLYLAYGEAEGIRGDIAFAQRCLETGNDTYKGSAVTPEQHNYGGFGVTKKGEKGESFPDAATGILVHIHHLKAYANEKELVAACSDPRFKYVQRGCAPYVEWLGQQENPANVGKAKKDWVGWAAGKGYGNKILSILANILKESGSTSDGGGQESPEPETDGIYLVTTTVDSLRIRKGPGTSYAIAGGINETVGEKKKYTIVEEQNGWGRLKSGAGWIYLWYTRRVG